MPLASWFSLHWYGPAAGASRIVATGEQAADIRAFGAPAGALAGTGSVPNADATRLVNRPATIAGAGTVAAGPMRGRARIAAPIRVGAFTQDDVSSGVLNAIVEGGVTVGGALRLLVAHAAGNASGLDGGGTYRFKALDGTTDRVVGTVTSGARTVTTRNAG